MGISKIPERIQVPHPSTSEHEKSKKVIKGVREVVETKSRKIVSPVVTADDMSAFFRPSEQKKPSSGAVSTAREENARLGQVPRFSFELTDPLTGQTFQELAKSRFERDRPYCLAVASEIKKPRTLSSKMYFDGAEYLSQIDEDTFHLPCSFTINSEKKVIIESVQFFPILKGRTLHKIGEIQDTLSGPHSIVLRSLITQEENKNVKTTGWVTDVLTASAYHLGIGVVADQGYAGRILANLTAYAKRASAPDLYAFVLDPEIDLRLVKFLLDNNFDPRVEDPCDGASSIQVAKDFGNVEALRLFKQYGYVSEVGETGSRDQ